MKNKNTEKYPSRLPSADILINTDNQFSLKLGGTIYEITTHFNTAGKQTVLQQFMELLNSVPIQ